MDAGNVISPCCSRETLLVDQAVHYGRYDRAQKTGPEMAMLWHAVGVIRN